MDENGAIMTSGIENSSFISGGAVFSAIDLGTNNCRLLIAVPHGRSFRVTDSFSRIVRLGEGVMSSGRLSEAAMARTLEALNVCATKVASGHVTLQRNIATQACRAASNGNEFVSRIHKETGLNFEIVSEETEAKLSVQGCLDLMDSSANAVLVFDIGGGSTEISWLRMTGWQNNIPQTETAAWMSLPLGVVSIAERFGHDDMTSGDYNLLADEVGAKIRQMEVPEDIRQSFREGKAHLIGTSGTVTSMAGVHLDLPAYSRRAVDGLWMSMDEVREVAERLRLMPIELKATAPCIGAERAPLVVGGCAVLEGILRVWPAERIRVGDRGLREGLLLELISRWYTQSSPA